MSQCNTIFDLKINLGHSDLYFMVRWFQSFIFWCENILILLAKPDSGELRCPVTALISIGLIIFKDLLFTEPARIANKLCLCDQIYTKLLWISSKN